ncbi:hypothetical protein DRP04_07195 [Archaeoglobales archaeon]|nr:MAG: hypothetical protein DRP04_07195 [Archaeoglobales archaeon]
MLIEYLRQIILKMLEDPIYSKPKIVELPSPLSRKLRGYLISKLRRQGDEHAARVFNEQFRRGNLDISLNRAFRYLIDECGINDQEEIEKFLAKMLDEIIKRKRNVWRKPKFEVFENPVDNSIFESMLQHALSSKTKDETGEIIEYGKQNGFFYWDGEKWHVTNLGHFFIKLSPLQAVKFLLLVEIGQSRGINDNWHISEKFLRKLFEVKEMSWYLENPKELADYNSKWVKRLNDLGIVEREIVYVDPVYIPIEIRDNIKLNKMGKIVLEEILNTEKDSLSILLELLYRQELRFSSDLLAYYTSSETIEKLKRLFEDGKLVRGQEREIQASLRAFEDGNYISSLKTLIPTIEGIVRNIYVSKGLGGTDKDLEPMLQELRSNKWITKETEGLVISLGRAKKLHGLEGLSEQEAQVYCIIGLKALEGIFKDYYFFTALRLCFEKISEIEPNISEEYLLEAYPNKRKEVHVQIKEHSLESLYKKVELICTLPKYDRVYSFRVDLEKNIVKSNGA